MLFNDFHGSCEKQVSKMNLFHWREESPIKSTQCQAFLTNSYTPFWLCTLNFLQTSLKKNRMYKMCYTYKILANVIEIFPIFVQCLFKQIGLWGWPLLHLVSTEHGAPCGDQAGVSFGQFIGRLVQVIHSMEL